MLAVSGWALFAQAGCIASYGPNLQDAYRHPAVYADRILKGAKQSSLPVEQPTNSWVRSWPMLVTSWATIR